MNSKAKRAVAESLFGLLIRITIFIILSLGVVHIMGQIDRIEKAVTSTQQCQQ